MAKQVNVKIEIEGGLSIRRHLGLVIEQDLFNHHRFELNVPFDQLEDKGEHFFNRSHRNVLGKKITFSFSPRLNNDSFDFRFGGIITEIRLQTLSDMNSAFVLKGHSPTIVLEDAVQRRSFLDHTIKDIFDQVLTPYPQNLLRKGLSPQNGGRKEVFVQYNESNYAFLSRVADRCSEWFYYNGRELVLGHGNDAGEIDFLVDGRQNFDVAMVLHPSVFAMGRYNYFKDQSFTSPSASQRVDGLTTLSDFALKESDAIFAQSALLRIPEAIRNQSESDEIVRMEKAARVSSMVDFQGSGETPTISVGTVLAVKGDRLNANGQPFQESFGKYRVTSIRHMVNTAGGYQNTFRAVPESAQHPPRNPNVQVPLGQPEVAEVIDNDDPDRLGRVKCRFFWGQGRQPDQESLWLRVGTFHSSEGKGANFVPEKGAQVMIGYEGNLAELAYVMTSLYPKPKGDTKYTHPDNETKVITTKSGNIIGFSDKSGEPEIHISNLNNTDVGLLIQFQGDGTIKMQTKGGGKIEMETGELAITASNIRMKANQKFELEAGEISIKSTQGDIKVESMVNIDAKATAAMTLEANTKLTAEGKVSATLEGAKTKVGGKALVEVSAPLVKIN